mmetsp:Transcript_7237/g.11965  ORF Transcript_7237/g.11965 Transcript_7237/m.11965 type:complete len:219 (+) Transcript_7237:1085-1741(+)
MDFDVEAFGEVSSRFASVKVKAVGVFLVEGSEHLANVIGGFCVAGREEAEELRGRPRKERKGLEDRGGVVEGSEVLEVGADVTTDEAVEGGFATTHGDALDADPVEVVLGVDEVIKDLVGGGKVDVLADELVHDLHVGLLRAVKGHTAGDVLHDLADEDEGACLLTGDGLRGSGEKDLARVDDVRADVAEEEDVGERRVPHVVADTVLHLLEELDDDE